MNRRLLLLPAAVLVALAAAACGSSSNATPSAAGSVPGIVATPTATPTEAPTPTPTAPAATQSGPLASLNLPSFDIHAAPDLEAMLPSSIGGQAVQKYSLSLAQLGALGQTGGTDQTFLAWIHALGKNPSDVTMAVGTTSGTPALTVGAIRVAGVDQTVLISSFQAASQASKMTVTQGTIGGKQVMKVVDPAQSGTTTYIYAKGDTLLFTEASDDATAAAVIQALP